MTASDVTESKPESSGLEALFEGLAERLGRSARAAAVFGEAVERDGVTVIPVARARWGMGGGSGPQPGRAGQGVGGGGGAITSPVGYIELRNGESRFKPIVDLKAVLGLALAAGALLALALRRRHRE
jgi:uncharacterized spore protein YtfJ